MYHLNCNNIGMYDLKQYQYSYYINDIYIIIKDIVVCDVKNVSFWKIKLEFALYIFISFFLLLFNLLFKLKIDDNVEIALARVARTKNKISNVFSDIQFIEDDIKNFNFMIYRIGDRRERLKFIYGNFLKLCFADYNEIVSILSTTNIKCDKKILRWFVKRIPHTVVYAKSINNIFKYYKSKIIYTGQMQDRFALIEYKAARMYNKTLICIPHGVETCYVLPSGLSGDIVYCTSVEIAQHLNRIYKTSKFIYNNDILEKMYCIRDLSIISDKYKTNKVVFFTQPIEVEKSIEIISNLSKMFFPQRKIYIKVHPLEKKESYDIYNTEFIDDFNAALYGSCCISLASTVLIESKFNKSVSVSIINLVISDWELTCEYEYLKDLNINKPRSIHELIKLINEYYVS